MRVEAERFAGSGPLTVRITLTPPVERPGVVRPPRDIVTAELVEEVFGLRCRVLPDPEAGTPMVVPRVRERRSAGVDRPPVLVKGSSPD